MSLPIRRWLAVGLVLTLLPFSAVAAPDAEHVFQPGDEIEIQVLTSPDSMVGYVQRIVLSSEGVISLPHVGRVIVVGRTAPQLLPDLDSQYRKRFAYATVSLQLLKAKPLEPPPTEAVYVSGQVRFPGAVTPLQTGKRLTLADLIGRAGGPTDVADVEHVTIYRRLGTVEVVNLERALADGSATHLELVAGETVRVPGNWIAGLSTYSPALQAASGVIGMVVLVFGLWNASGRTATGVAAP
jgi:protein involved in polysaccharide export with SLBB domain